MVVKTKNTYKGTRILFGETAFYKRKMLNNMSEILIKNGFDEMMIPIMQKQEIFASKVGEENNNMMYTFKDRGDRDLCLAPEYTAVIQELTFEQFKYNKDVKLFYIGECFRGENCQAGRYRQFTQLGIEILNPSKDYLDYLIKIASELIECVTDKYTVNTDAKRGLDYYIDGKGFEIACEDLGSSKQICGGGSYQNGIGFAIGIDRLLLLKK